MILTYFKQHYIRALILLSIIVNALGLLFPITRNDDLTLYASIAKHIALSHDWINLTHPMSIDWLDKPHLPFWLIALSFKTFGINSFAYLLCGFLFNLIGGYYTFCLAKVLYNKTTALFATLIYFSTFHLQLSASLDVRAEAYLMGMIIPACYYWYCYYKSDKIQFKSLLLGALFTACAMMTKGVFTLITVFSGVGVLYIYSLLQGGGYCNANKVSYSNLWCYWFRRHCEHCIAMRGNLCVSSRLEDSILQKPLLFQCLKWSLALFLSLLFILPELIAIYLQFDAHPEKVIFGHTHVSGIRWFFWDSQFGRFFNTGPISRNATSLWHYLFFVHTFIWAFLPWSIIFIASLWYLIKRELKQQATLYLLSSFFITFIIFSLTKFQLDYYTNIIMPFAVIICARWLYHIQENIVNSPKKIFIMQKILALLLVFAVTGLSIFIFSGWLLSVMLLTGLGVVTLFILLWSNSIKNILIYSVVSINLVFIFILLIYGFIAVNYDVGYKVAQDLNKKIELQGTKKPVVVDFDVHSLTLEFYTKSKYMLLSETNELSSIPRPFYIVALATNEAAILGGLNNATVINYYYGTTIDKVMANLLHIEHLNNQLTKYMVIQVK